jgi:two-component system, NtrC family, sensor histidine kinase HydH
MPDIRKFQRAFRDQRAIVTTIIAVAVIFLLLTWIAIRESRQDSFSLLERQGKTFTNALAEAAQNAIAAESYYDRFVQRRYGDLVTTILSIDFRRLSVDTLADFAQDHDLRTVYIFKKDSTLLIGASFRGDPATPPRFVQREAEALLAQPETRFTQLLDHDVKTDETTQYYLEITPSLDMVVVVSADAGYYSEAIRQTGIGFLAQRMAEEPGVEYVIYQSTEGIIFSSRQVGKLLAIESDPFLQSAMLADSATSRVYDFQDKTVLEIVKPFASSQYPSGLFRVGVSLDKYYDVSRGYDIQMVIVSASLFVLATLAIMYLNSRRKRREISQQYSDIKSVTDRIFEQMKVGIAVVSDAGVIQVANAALEQALGAKGLIGRNWDEVAPIDELGFKACIASRQQEREVTFPVGPTVKSLMVATSRVSSEDNKSGALVVIVYDTTRFRQYEREANRRERLSEMGNLAAGVAHEIRNPLNTISIAAQRLAAEFAPQENGAEYLEFTERIRQETKRLNEIITRFLALAREDKRKRQSLNLASELSEFKALVEDEAKKAGIEISIQPTVGVRFEAEPNEFRQVLLNLYNNTKEALAGEPGKIAIAGTADAGRVRISFDDSGPGIPVELRTQVFTPYFTTKEAGTGLGLPTVHRIVTGMDGDIQLSESALGGACFIITLPSPQA